MIAGFFFFFVEVDDRLAPKGPGDVCVGPPFVGTMAFAFDAIELVQLDEVSGHTRVLVAFKDHSRASITMRTSTLRAFVKAQLVEAGVGERLTFK